MSRDLFGALVPETAPEAPGKRKRERDALFDALAEVTQSDPKASASYIAKVAKALRSAEPPYTPEEVRQLAVILARRGFQAPFSLGTVEKHIGWVRSGPQVPRLYTGLAEFARNQT